MTDDDLLLLRSTKFLSLFAEYYQLDMLLHSEWVLFATGPRAQSSTGLGGIPQNHSVGPVIMDVIPSA